MRKILLRAISFLLVTAFIAACSNLSGVDYSRGFPERAGTNKEASITTLAATLTDLTTSLTADDLATALVGSGVTINSATYTGDPISAGAFSFTGADDVIGFGEGVILGSGDINTVTGPNSSDGTSVDTSGGNDSDLAALIGDPVNDAAVLEIQFTPTANTVFFEYVFGSEEYNEFVNSPFNDVFAFFVNGENCAKVNGTPVSINNVNGGNPFGTNSTNPAFYRNNDPNDPGPATINTELDGLTTILICEASVNPGEVNTLKLAIADVADSSLDSFVFIKAGSLSTEAPGSINLDPASAINPIGTDHTVTATIRDSSDAPIVGETIDFEVVSGPNAGESGSGMSDSLGQANFTYTGDGGPGNDTIQASFTDATGRVKAATATKTWEAGQTPTDMIAPTCELVSIAKGPPVTLTVKAQDLDSGLAEIIVTKAVNATVNVPSFTSGTTSMQTVIAEKIDSSKKSQIELNVKDVAGNITVCDPVIVELEITSSWGRTSVDVADIPATETQVSVLNGGVSMLRAKINGGRTHVMKLANNESLDLDMSSSMTSGSNSASLVAHGDVGTSVLVMFHDGSASLAGPKLQGGLRTQGAGPKANLSWGGF